MMLEYSNFYTFFVSSYTMSFGILNEKRCKRMPNVLKVRHWKGELIWSIMFGVFWGLKIEFLRFFPLSHKFKKNGFFEKTAIS